MLKVISFLFLSQLAMANSNLQSLSKVKGINLDRFSLGDCNNKISKLYIEDKKVKLLLHEESTEDKAVISCSWSDSSHRDLKRSGRLNKMLDDKGVILKTVRDNPGTYWKSVITGKIESSALSFYKNESSGALKSISLRLLVPGSTFSYGSFREPKIQYNKVHLKISIPQSKAVLTTEDFENLFGYLIKL